MSGAIGVVLPGKEVLVPVPEYCVHPPGCGTHEVEVGWWRDLLGLTRGGIDVEGQQLVLCLGSILHEWVPTQDLPVVLIVIVTDQPHRCPRPSGGNTATETAVFQLFSLYC